MIRTFAFAVLALAVMPARAGAAELAAEAGDTGVRVTVDGTLFTEYKTGHDQKYPYFWPVNGPASGESVTTETSEPYPHHHSLFFGCDRVNGGNYWQDVNARGQILSQGTKVTTASGELVEFTDECLWKQPEQEPIIRDTRVIAVCAPDESQRIIDFTITIEPLVDVHIEQTNHSLFSARMVPELSVQSGGTLVNAQGDTAEKGTYGVESPWCDYYGARNGQTEGLAIFQNPGNRWFPSKWFTRDYGFFSPTPLQWIGEGGLDLPKGQPLTLKYRVVVHAGTTDEAEIPALWEAYGK